MEPLMESFRCSIRMLRSTSQEQNHICPRWEWTFTCACESDRSLRRSARLVRLTACPQQIQLFECRSRNSRLTESPSTFRSTITNLTTFSARKRQQRTFTCLLSNHYFLSCSKEESSHSLPMVRPAQGKPILWSEFRNLLSETCMTQQSRNTVPWTPNSRSPSMRSTEDVC